MNKSLVVLRSVAGENLADVVEEIMARCDWEALVPPNGSVFIKPNLCTEEIEKVESANTSPELVAAICKVLQRRTRNITICESDGCRYSADTAFRNTGLDTVATAIGVKWMNLSREKAVLVGHPIFDRAKTGLPEPLLKADLLINVPVIKTHALTVFTGAIKNLWGCVPRYDRIELHKDLDELMSDLVGILRPRLNIMDGIVCSEGRGPTNGIPRRLDVVLASRDPVALDATAMRLVGLGHLTANHVALAQRKGHGTMKTEEIEVDGDFDGLKVQFIPAVLDAAVAAMNYLTRYHFFVRYILFNQTIFRIAKGMVSVLRRIGLLKDIDLKAGNRPLGDSPQ